jgi:hypothetical protein
MHTERSLRHAFETMMDALPVPAPRLAEVRATARSAPRTAGRFTPAAGYAAAAAVALAVLPIVAPAIAHEVEREYPALLRIFHMGPPAMPQHLAAQMRSESRAVTLEQARSAVRFAVVPPAGLPGDVTSRSIAISTTATYSSATKTWRRSHDELSFVYERSGGREFTILLDSYDPAERHPAFVFEEVDGPHGATFVKHQNFAWRNGDQVALVAAGSGVSAREIEAIRAAMGGEPLPLVQPDPAAGAATVKFRMIPEKP